MRRSTGRTGRLGVMIAAVLAALAFALLPTGAAQAAAAGKPGAPVLDAPADPNAVNPPCEAIGSVTTLATVNFRRAPDTGATVDGIIPEGTSVPWCGIVENAGVYSACGVENWDYWDQVNWNGQSGYVVGACTELDE